MMDDQTRQAGLDPSLVFSLVQAPAAIGSPMAVVDLCKFRNADQAEPDGALCRLWLAG